MKAIIKNIPTDNSNEKMLSFAQTIDFAELFEHVKSFASINCTFYQPEITTRHGEVYISFMSDDITNQTGPFAAILDKCYLHSFSNGVYKHKETSKFCYWVNVNIWYEHKDGGSNGMDMVRANYTNGSWKFMDAGQKVRG